MTLQLRVTLNAGSPQTGGVTAVYSDVVHLDAANYVGWGLATWTIYAYPDGFAVPAGWTEVTVEQASGLFATVYQYQGTTPPSFTLPAATYWGKWLLSLSVVIGGETVTDEATGIEILSPSLLHDTAWREGVQFGGWQKWVADVAANWRTIEAAIVGFAADATVTATANKILRRGASAEAKAAWLESGTGTPATTGLVRSANNTAIIGSYGGGAYNVPVLTVNASDVHVHGDDTRTGGYEIRSKTGGLWKLFVNNVESVRLDASGVSTDAVLERTSAAGVTVDGLLIKDSHLPAKYRWREERWQKEDDALAITATTPRPFATLKYACTVTDVNYRAHDALTADNTDNVVITVYAYTDAGVLVGKVAEYISDVATGGLSSEVAKDFGAVTNAACGAGYGLVVAITKGGTGKIVPAGVLTVNTTLD